MTLAIYLDDPPQPSRWAELESLGVARYFIAYQGHVDKQFATSGVANPKAMLDWAMATLPKGKPCEVLCDFETPADDVIFNLQATGRKACINSLNDAMRALRLACPLASASYFAWPACQWDHDTRGWGSLGETDRFEVRQDLAARYRSVLRECSMVCPAPYSTHEWHMPSEAIGWRLDRLRIARDIAGTRPVVPVANLQYADYSFVPIDTLIVEQVVPALIARCPAVMLWTASDHHIEVATVHQPSALQATLRAAYDAEFGAIPWGKAHAGDTLREAIHERTVRVIEAVRRIAG